MSTKFTGRVPGSTYRLQLHAGFTLDDAAELVDYLADLGVTHVYCSPILQAVVGSVHGYDTVDHGAINAELGGRAAFDRLVDATKRRGMGIVLDIVPNHMAVNDPGNKQWWDVLKCGPDSRYAAWFDIDWAAPATPGRLLLPVLGDELDVVLAAGDVTVDTRDGVPVLRYHESVFPIADGTGDGTVEEIVALQHYLLAHWRRGTDLNYRRFFDVTSLAGLRVEDEAVFDATHELILSLVESGAVDGLRVDHPDGLADPAGYFERLRSRAPGAWLVIEKILEPGESLDTRWPVDGTTGYDALHDVNAVFVDPAGRESLEGLLAEVAGGSIEWPKLVYAAKSQTIDLLFTAELDWLSRAAAVDGTLVPATREALRELIACFPVYRSYLRAGEVPRNDDLEVIESARVEAIRRRPDLAPAIAAVVAAIRDDAASGELRTRFQQTTGPVMAKGVEDTAFYRYHRLVSLNEVGGDPGSFGSSLADFHAACATRLAHWPDSMTALSTHDTKRSEDVRARISLLPQVVDMWAHVVRGWFARGNQHWSVEPDRATEYLLFQTLLGAWPISVDRLRAYAEKASREAKQRTSWTDPDPLYDAALQGFVSALRHDRDFIADLESFVTPLDWFGRIASLAQKLVQLTMPGVPDIYQGTEVWDLSLVDPDNRRPVDYAERRRLLALLPGCTVHEVTMRSDEGLPKLLVVQKALALRRRLPDVFATGSYEPLEATGPGADSVIAFARGGAVATVVPCASTHDDWQATQVTLPDGDWLNEFTRGVVSGTVLVEELLEDFPVALLSRR